MSAEKIFEGERPSTAAYLLGQIKVARDTFMSRCYPFGKDYVSPGDRFAEAAKMDSKPVCQSEVKSA